MSSSQTSGAAFVEHWAVAGGKGLMNQSTAKALEASCRRVLETVEGWENVDITTVDLDDLVNRFKNLNSRQFKPRSLKDYEQRFRRAVSSYKIYLEDPSSWKYASRSPSRRGSANDREQRGDVEPTSTRTDTGSTPPLSNTYTYTYPFREDAMARLEIPRDAKKVEIDRLIAWARTLAIDYEPSE